LVTFGCGITIPKGEEHACQRLVQPAVYAASLTNDLFSYQKEFEAAQRAGQPDIVNALWVLMCEHNVTRDDAEAMCKTRIKEEVAKYVKIVEETKASADLSNASKRYIELMQYSVSGNVVWSLQCPRYHKNLALTEEQLLRRISVQENLLATDESDHKRKRSRSSSPSSSDTQKHRKANGNSNATEDRKRASISGATDSASKNDACEDIWDCPAKLSLELPKLGEGVSSPPYSRHY
jgi:hypothetical protein